MRQTPTIRRLPTRGSSQAPADMAATDPTGVARSTRPRLPSESPRRALTCGMCAVQEAKRSPCAKKTNRKVRRSLNMAPDATAPRMRP